MPVLGITGGIATGKSTFTRSLLRCIPAEVFDADACAKDLLENDPTVHEQVRDRFGPAVFNAAGQADRAALRSLIFADPTKRAELEGILHPSIRRRWTERAESIRQSRGWYLVDIPLLFETRAEPEFDRVVVVACSTATQRDRLRSARGLNETVATQIIEAQLDLELKIRKADHLIWNDAGPEILDDQARLFSSWLRQRYG